MRYTLFIIVLTILCMGACRDNGSGKDDGGTQDTEKDTNTITDEDTNTDEDANTEIDTQQTSCPVTNYPADSPACERFIDNPIDGLAGELNRTFTCDNPPSQGEANPKCWDEGVAGTPRYVGLCFNIDEKGVCIPVHLGVHDGQLTPDDAISCINGEVSDTVSGAKICYSLCANQDDSADGTSCSGGRYCVKIATDDGEKYICGGEL